MRADIVPGAVFPGYELSDHRGTRRKLSELQQGDPLVLALARGGFCPKTGDSTTAFCEFGALGTAAFDANDPKSPESFFPDPGRNS